jgi:hypothetical protein
VAIGYILRLFTIFFPVLVTCAKKNLATLALIRLSPDRMGSVSASAEVEETILKVMAQLDSFAKRKKSLF